jgi:hypothetical protein
MSMGVVFEGVPTQARAGRSSGGVWRSDIFSAEERAAQKPPARGQRT